MALPAAPLSVGVVSLVRLLLAGVVSVTPGEVVSTTKVLALDAALVLPAASPWVAWTV